MISVRHDANGVKVAVMDTKSGKKSELSADFCAVCLPLPIIAKLDISFSPEMMTAVKAVPTSNSAKMGLQMKRRWWEEDDRIFGGHLYSNLPLGEFSYPSTGYFSKKGVILGLYANGPVGDLLDRTHAERLEHVVSNASKVHPQVRTELETSFGVWWKKVRVQRRGLRHRRGARSARPALEDRGSPRHRFGRGLPVLRARLAGRCSRRWLADGEDDPRTRDEGLTRVRQHRLVNNALN
ncbi:MAG: FAD-dependent oxidoreductase [Vicinamibacterales bacterium]